MSQHFLKLHALATFCFMRDTNFSDAQLQTFTNSASYPQSNRSEQQLRNCRAINIDGETALHVASRYGNIAVVKLILKGTRFLQGGQAAMDLLFSESSTGRIPLEECMVGGSKPVAETLLGFEKEQVTGTSGKRQLGYTKPGGSNVFIKMLSEADEDFILLLLKYATADEYDSKDVDGITAVHIAPERDFVQVLKWLQDQGAEVNATNGSGRTPLFMLTGCGSLIATEFLSPSWRPGTVCLDRSTLQEAEDRRRRFDKRRRKSKGERQEMVDLLRRAAADGEQ